MAADARGNFLLDGVTGSGKTEVYLRAVGEVLAARRIGAGAVPGDRAHAAVAGAIRAAFRSQHRRAAFGAHRHRTRAWRGSSAATGQARIVIGTRSAVFTPIPGLAAHHRRRGTRCFVQAAGRWLPLLRARPGAAARAAAESAGGTGLGHAFARKPAQRCCLDGSRTCCCRNARAAPCRRRLALIDMRAHAVHKGIAMPVLQAMQRHLEAGTQVLLYPEPPRLCAHPAVPGLRLDRALPQLRCAHDGALAAATGWPAITAARTSRCRNAARAAAMKCIRWARAPSAWKKPWPSVFRIMPVERFDRDALRAAASSSTAPSSACTAAARASWWARRC